MRYACIVSYDGTNFHGFQVQKDLRTVQKVLEEVLLIITKTKTTVYASGRTDAKVHAYGQVFHFDTDIDMKDENMKNAINCRLPSDVHIDSVSHVSDDFHARFSAHEKTYEYLVDTAEYNPLLANYRWFYKYKFSLDLLRTAGNIFIGEHDFASFSKNQKLENTVRTIYSFEILEEGSLLRIRFNGNGFLHNQVRIMVAMMFEVARGKITVERLKEILDAKNRKLSPKTAPPQGLYLVSVSY